MQNEENKLKLKQSIKNLRENLQNRYTLFSPHREIVLVFIRVTNSDVIFVLYA